MLKYENIDFYHSENQLKIMEHIKCELIFGDLNRPIPKYTIAIATYRRPELLEKTLLSALKQKGTKDFEIIVLEHGQINDDTERMLCKYKKHKNLFYYKLSEWIHYGTWNHAIKLSRTKWVTILCDDDLLTNNYILTIDNIIKNFPEADGIAPKIKSFYSSSQKESLLKKLQNPFDFLKTIFQKNDYYIGKYCIDNYLTRNGVYSQHAVMYQRNKVLELGCWDIKYYACCDMILNVNYIKNYKMYYTTEVLGLKREGEGNFSGEKHIKIDAIYFYYCFLKTLKPYLKYLEFDKKYNELCIVNMILRECKLTFEDFDSAIPKKYFTEEYLFEYRQLKEKYLKQLNEAEPAFAKYTRKGLSIHFKLTKNNFDFSINANIDLMQIIKNPKNKSNISKIIQKYANKKILLYGSGILAEMLFKQFDISKLNIMAVADLEYQYKKEFNSIKIISPEEIKKYNFDVLLITMYKAEIAKEYLENVIFKNEKIKFKIEPMIKF